MNTFVAAVQQRSASCSERIIDYLELVRIRIALLVLVTVLVAGLLGSWGQPDPLALLGAVVGTTLVAASASIFNQWLERDRDAKMHRTEDRPLPAGRVGNVEALALGGFTVLFGTAVLVWGGGWSAALLGLVTWILYVLVYTPLKVLTAWNTWVGAVAGAMPVAIGWLACGGQLDLRLAVVWMLLFLWQFPHFMAIAWIYRQDYARGGLKMLTVVEPTGTAAGIQAVAGALSLVPISLIIVLDLSPVMTLQGAWLCGSVVLTAGLAQLILAGGFWRERNDAAARQLLRASLVYLPVVLGILALGPLL